MLPRSTMISSNQGVLVNGGQFTQHNYHGQASTGNEAPFDILKGAVASNALHDSGASIDRPKCHPRTREKVLEIIMRWILGVEDENIQASKQFMWLNGAAGCGKSAIAQSTIESCIEQGLLLASFFFSRSDPTRNHAGSLVATLAYQLYCAFPQTSVQTDILSAIQKDPLIFKKTLQQQFTSLIVQPLMTHFSKDQSTQHRVPFLIVIDGLDECTDRTAQKAILTGLAESVRNSNLCIPIFVASRPEHDIKLSFSSRYLEDMHTGLSLDLEDGRDTDSDIRLYLFDRFAQIKDDFNKRTTGRKLDQDWPEDKVIETLVRKSSRQFIYAATVIRYVESTRYRPDHRLDIVLNIRPVNGDHPFAELDALYATILESALEIEKVLRVLSLHFMPGGSRICCSIIEKLLSYDEGEVEAIFSDMGALVQISKDRDAFPLRDVLYDPEDSPSFLLVLHASLRDFLWDDARSKQFHINIHSEFIKHITHVLRYLSSYCSTSFDPNSIAGTPMYILPLHVEYRLVLGSSRTTIPLDSELQQSVLSFPLKEFLEPHTSARTYPQLLENFVSPFLHLLEAMVLNDPTSSYIQDQQLGILQSALELQIQQYFKNDRLALILVLFYHVPGSHRFVPILKPIYDSYMHSTPFHGMSAYFNEGDVLSLGHIWNNTSFEFTDNTFHRYVRKLLHDPGQITKYTIGPVMHERAALACFKELAMVAPVLPSSSGHNITIATGAGGAEDDANPKLIFYFEHHVPWQFKCSSDAELEDEELYFLLLGYLIFLLPRCGKSDALVAACEEHDRMLYMDQPDGPFPVRRRLLRVEINNYIAQASLPNRAGCCFVM
ncbi:hypothetical protein D9613_006356 [Agrocybe pediades]|uniref:Nephrocystin 3-like N-terminal domain-containing protein n=1 Tax=Agrocybe pediades TaxID=84607 RepID=A0A8H4QU09_9AGAR|nr:hypothetical protein D9613_006356 [Agrocybe pediades]